MTNAYKFAGKFSRKHLPSSTTYYENQGIKLKGGGAWRDAICCFHPDTKPSLRINVEKALTAVWYVARMVVTCWLFICTSMGLIL